MKQKFKWLIDVADKKPLLFSVLLLLIGISVLSAVVQNRENRLNSCEEEGRQREIEYKRKVDSVARYYAGQNAVLNDEVKNTLKGIIDEYKKRLEEQKGLSDKVNNTIIENKKIIQQKNSRQL